jgi:hypothetical protein
MSPTGYDGCVLTLRCLFIFSSSPMAIYTPDTSSSYNGDTQFTYNQNYATTSHSIDDDQDDDDDDEDVFAFLPPSTADQQRSNLSHPSHSQSLQPALRPHTAHHNLPALPLYPDPSSQHSAPTPPDSDYHIRNGPAPSHPIRTVPHTASTSATLTPPHSVSSAASSRRRDVHVPLPEKDLEHRSHAKMRPFSNQDSINSPSMLEEDSRAGSIK